MAFLLDLPTKDSVEICAAINIWITLAGTNHIVFYMDNILTIQRLRDLGWNETTVGCGAERDINVQCGLMARQVHYALKYIGATIINKSIGATLLYGIAVEILVTYSPWESGQIVVALSQSESPECTIIVGDKTISGHVTPNIFWT